MPGSTSPPPGFSEESGEDDCSGSEVSEEVSGVLGSVTVDEAADEVLDEVLFSSGTEEGLLDEVSVLEEVGDEDEAGFLESSLP